MIIVEIQEGGYSPVLELLIDANYCWMCGVPLVTASERGESVFFAPYKETEVYDIKCKECGDTLVRHHVALSGQAIIQGRRLKRSEKFAGFRHD